MSSGNSDKFGGITEYFKKHDDIEITCISDNLNSDIFKLKPPENVKTLYLPKDDSEKYFSDNHFDLIVINNYKSEFNRNICRLCEIIKVHPSLLPAFPDDNAITQAFDAGVKVSGITIHTITEEEENDKIIAQYPILISNLMHYDEFEKAVLNLENLITPIVVEKLLDNKLFDFQDLFDNHHHGCGGNCGGCGGCH